MIDCLRYAQIFHLFLYFSNETIAKLQTKPKLVRDEPAATASCNLQLVPVDFWSRKRDAADPLNPPKQPVGDGWHTHTKGNARKRPKRPTNHRKERCKLHSAVSKYWNIEMENAQTLVHKSLLILRDINPKVA